LFFPYMEQPHAQTAKSAARTLREKVGLSRQSWVLGCAVGVSLGVSLRRLENARR